ncbi:hypothetical protein K0504_02740 [Neiella marina]|uniref:Uncharacterized protein n=1 Tax=Neiella holothuriorum TaxID=2870530 RepID=A0ABS7EDE4_9GAMM|nr:hypothetical protein [Neiella holothuriorum]MBW8189938.1 hypothetical protein [Neiella holothuriorum]
MKTNITGLVACLLISVPAANAVDWQAEWQLCSSVSNDKQRLACFDGITKRQFASPERQDLTSNTKPVVPVADVPEQSISASSEAAVVAAKPSAQQAFGLEREIAKQQTKELDEISAEVTAVSKDPYGKLTLTLDNQQRWKLQEKGPRLKTGDTVIVSRGALGSFYVNKAGVSRKSRAKRLD